MTVDAVLLSRIEDAGLNASAPREQRWVDGWLLRTAPGKAKRARCVQPVAPGVGPLDERLARCADAFRGAGLPLVVRVTPFAQPPGLDAWLAAAGMVRIDDTLVMVAAVEDVAAVDAREARARDSEAIEAVDGAAYARWIGAARGSTPTEIEAHADRLAGSPVPYRAFLSRDPDDASIVAGGQVAVEDGVAGFYDVMTRADRRRRGLARRLCLGMACEAASLDVRTLYLQVDAANAAAISLYRALGFEDAYRYHYRTPPEPPSH